MSSAPQDSSNTTANWVGASHMQLLPDSSPTPSPEVPVLVQTRGSDGWECPCPAIMRVIGAIVALATLVCMVVFPWVGIPFVLGYATLVVLAGATTLSVAVNLIL